jgi:biotin carboxyl carrier protein
MTGSHGGEKTPTAEQHLPKVDRVFGGINHMTEILSTISGKVKEIHIRAGQMITEVDEIVTIETMKTENTVYGEPGIVKEIKVSVNESVDEGDVVAIVL